MRLALQGIQARHAAASVASRPVLNDVSLHLGTGEQAAVIGPSGAGKTTLLHVAAAALRPVSGSVQLDGQHPWQCSAAQLKALRGRLFLAPQVPPLPPRQRVITAVLAARLPAQGLWASVRSLLYPSDIPAAHAALERFDLGDKLFDRVDRLSGGERQRIGLSRALLSPASLWLIDEPLSSLDPTRAQQAIGALTALARAQRITLLATLHHVEMALEHFPRIIGLRDGEVAFDLPAAQVTPGHLERLYEQAEGSPAALPEVMIDDAQAVPAGVMHCR
ncbi:MAG: ATP-binding cassette domain-containing protein [Rubrivivax sp.]